ncbi:MAG: multicopper oxidase domain-containing protein, partial [Gemmatimonadaceae bacterium]
MNTASAVLLSGLLVSFSGASTLLYRAGADPGAPTRISTNDNRRVAGTLRDGKLELKLEIVNGNWFPESDSGPSAVMQAFAEVGRAPEIPGPMIRVTEGTVIHVTLRNLLPDAEVVVHGLHSRPATTDEGISIPAGATRDVTFESGPPGTYFYWATTTKNTLLYRNDLDSQLSGAIIVDPRDAPPAKDRTFVIGVFHQDTDSVAGRVPHPREIVVVNGKS